MKLAGGYFDHATSVNAMIEYFWGCLVGGIVFSVITLLGGHAPHHGLHGLHAPHGGHGLPKLKGHGFLDLTSIVAGITMFGGAGILLARYTPVSETLQIVLAVAAAISMSILVHVAFIRPISRAESSIGYSMGELVGKSGTVTIPLPEEGRGEIMLKLTGANICQIAASFDGNEIPRGRTVVVVEVRDNTLYVTEFDREMETRLPDRSGADLTIS